jgi:hypothetical protein
MASTDELRRELRDERVELAQAVGELRVKVDDAKRLAAKVPLALAGAGVLSAVVRVLLSRKR